jgi:DNA-directed RNA polymerase subunit H (RpoH/RPB5)
VAKQHGSNKVYKAEGAVLNVKAWDAARDAAMFGILQARYEVDEEFRKILEASKESNVGLLHYERSGPSSYWGGAVKEGAIVGENKLGKMMMALREGKGGDEVSVTQDVLPEEAQAGPAPSTPPPVTSSEPDAAEPPSLASMGRASSSVGAVSFVRRVFTARATRLSQLASLGYKVGHLQGMSPADVDRQMQDQELNFVVSGTSASQRPVHVRFHIDKALRQVHINTLADEFRELGGFNIAHDTVVLISKDLPNDSVRAAVVSARAGGGPYIVIQALAELQYNVLTHRDVPAHRAMSANEIKVCREKYGLTAHNGILKLAGISQFDPVARAMLFRPGTVCEITRPSLSAGTCVYYRLCE